MESLHVSTSRKDSGMYALYRLYNDVGDLLYAGITNSVNSRFVDHRATKPWWYEVDDIRLKLYPDRTSAQSAETEAIRTEHPRYNIVGVDVEKRCPACHKPSSYSLKLDRYFHDDESDNRFCWARLTRGEIVPAWVA